MKKTLLFTLSFIYIFSSLITSDIAAQTSNSVFITPKNQITKYLVNPDEHNLGITNTTPLTCDKTTVKIGDTINIKFSFKNKIETNLLPIYVGIALTDKTTKAIKYILKGDIIPTGINGNQEFLVYHINNIVIPEEISPSSYELTPIGKLETTNWMPITSESGGGGAKLGLEITGNLSLDGTFLNNKKEKIKIYPNPVQDILHIKSDISIVEFAIYTLSGKQILISNKKDLTNSFSLSNLKKGIYILKLKTVDGTIISEKIIKN